MRPKFPSKANGILKNCFVGRNFRLVVCSGISIDGEKNDETSFCSRAWAWRQGWHDAGGKKSAGTVRSNLRIYCLCGFNPGRLSGEGISGQRHDKRSRTLSYGAFGSAGRKNDGDDLQRGRRGIRNGRACTVACRKVSGNGGCDRCGCDSGAFRGSSAGRTADERFCRDFPVRPSDAKGRDREKASCGGSGRFFHLSVQSVQQKAGGLSELGMPYFIRILCAGYALRLGADDRQAG